MLRTEELEQYREGDAYKAYLVTGEEQCLLWERITGSEVLPDDLENGQVMLKIVYHNSVPEFLAYLEKEEVLANGYLKIINPETAELSLNRLNRNRPVRESIADELWEDDVEAPVWDPTVKATTAEFGISLSQSEKEEQEKHRQWLMLQQAQD